MGYSEKVKTELREVGNEFLGAVRDEVDACVILCDSGRLHRLVRAVHYHMDAELVRTIREHPVGSKELEKLCDKIGVQDNIRRGK